MTIAAVSAWETNRRNPPAHKLIKLAKKLDIIDQLFENSENNNTKKEIEKLWQAINKIEKTLGSDK